MGYNPWGGRESDMTEQLDNNSTCFKVYILTGTELVTPCTFLIWVTIIFFSKSVDLFLLCNEAHLYPFLITPRSDII